MMNITKQMWAVAWVVVTLGFGGGCAGYAGKVESMRFALQAGQKDAALGYINESLDLKESDQYPVDVDSETSLLLLERASVKQANNMFEESAYDFRIADNNMELLDVKNKTVGEISKWIFSGDSGVYRAPPHEKLLINALNMLNYLALGDLESARVEARRFDLMQQYLTDGTESDLDSLGILGFGDYLAGFTFEMSKRYEQALQHYSDALDVNEYPSLSSVLPQLAACTPYRNDRLNQRLGPLQPASIASSAATSAAGESDTGADDTAAPVAAAAPCTYPDRETGTVLVVSSVGLAPHKKAVRLPVGAAVVIAGAYLAPNQMAQANDFAVKGLLKWVNFAELVQSPSQYTTVSVQVDQSPISSEYGDNVSQVVKDSFDKIKGKLIAAAIVRMIARAVAGAATNQAISSGSGKDGLGLLAQVLVEGAMTAADTPDTRSWNALPASIFFSRVEVPAGNHTVAVQFSGPGGNKVIKKEVTVRPGGFAVLPIHQLR
ncbi:MAG: hypothetical protein JXX29_11085 [Deltaproteobacteria bacterium]|nr:hypothetical protein [Deltaproteobacteria bacterium]MBN2672214.1 hypothetical protein [Deltaproteobacteria bacterium]